ncbi:MAG: putative toxin-antitoxin system toxin component, PIN family [Patescibacteria group bacterium]
MRIVLDTNVIISAFLWGGVPENILNQAENGLVQIFTCQQQLDELSDVLGRNQFRTQLEKINLTPSEIKNAFIALSSIILVSKIKPVIKADPDDDIILACAVESYSEYIISGDKHILNLKMHNGIEIITPANFYSLIS